MKFAIFWVAKDSTRAFSSWKLLNHDRLKLPPGLALSLRNNPPSLHWNEGKALVPIFPSPRSRQESQHVNLCTYFKTNYFPFIFKKRLELNFLTKFIGSRISPARFPILNKQLRKQKCPGTNSAVCQGQNLLCNVNHFFRRKEKTSKF
jgi:hypothetical protein